MKPLNRKAYGSIPHLPGSRRDESDKLLHPGQIRIVSEKPRKNDILVATEKLDGSCVAVARKDNKLWPLTRSGYCAITSPYPQHIFFHYWVSINRNKFCFLSEGERIVGEWLSLAHGIKYEIKSSDEVFFAFDIFDKNNNRYDFFEMQDICMDFDISTPSILQIEAGGEPLDIEMLKLKNSMHGGEFSEGFVFRVITKKGTDFLGKWVNRNHVCGKYFENSIYNWMPEKSFR